MRRERGGYARKNVHGASAGTHSHRNETNTGTDQPIGHHNTGSGRSRAEQFGSASEKSATGNAVPQRERRNAKRRKQRRRGTKAAWYAVVRGHNPGLYNNWADVQEHIRLSLAADIRDPRAYRYKDRTQALEGFLRWWNGRRVYSSASTMQDRGVTFLPTKYL